MTDQRRIIDITKLNAVVFEIDENQNQAHVNLYLRTRHLGTIEVSCSQIPEGFRNEGSELNYRITEYDDKSTDRVLEPPEVDLQKLEKFLSEYRVALQDPQENKEFLKRHFKL